MQKLIYSVLIFTVLTSCTSMKKYNEQINKPRTVKQLQSDVDFVSRKLEQFHPDLYWYISKTELDRKFDSLKTSIQKPMSSNEFYLRLSPVTASVRQGHLQLFPLTLKYRAKQRRSFKQYGTSPLSKFEFEWLNNSLYVEKNYSPFQELKPGTELVSVNQVSPRILLDKYNQVVASDGFNDTFLPRLMGKNFSSIYFWENGMADSVSCVLNYRDTIRQVWLSRFPKPKKIMIPTSEEVLARRKELKTRSIQGFDPLTGTLIRELNFQGNDSTIAVMKLRNFISGNYKTFYKNSFRTLRKAKTQTLILDLRDNPGGILTDVATLNSYLTDSDFVFINPPRVTSRTSLWHSNYFRGTPWIAKPFLLAFSPFRLVFMGRDYLNVRKEGDRIVYTGLKESKIIHPKDDRFDGKVYVLINGGTFSASCILSSNLKASDRVTFVGEETGGAFNGTVAGKMPAYRLPYSKLRFRFGLMTIRPLGQTETDGHGILPDVEIKILPDDLIGKKDPDLDWILENLGNQ